MRAKCRQHINHCHRGDHPIVLGQVKNNNFVDPGEIPPLRAGLKQERLYAKDQMKQAAQAERRALVERCQLSRVIPYFEVVARDDAIVEKHGQTFKISTPWRGSKGYTAQYKASFSYDQLNDYFKENKNSPLSMEGCSRKGVVFVKILS